MANPAHELMSREEFEEKLTKTERWKKIQEDLLARAYDDLQIGKLELSNDILLTTVIGIRGQDTGSIRLFHLNFLVKEIPNVDEPSEH